MSPRDDHADPAHDFGQPGDHDDGVHATLGGYVLGFVASVILTAIPFWLVMNKVIESPGITTVVILGLGVVQIFVHMIYFLHMDSKAEGGWSFMGLMFTVILVAITLSGSLWVMYHLNTHTMPLTPQQARNLP
jgi:cytochrome o ubiquinol oxidase operon protein cyoD